MKITSKRALLGLAMATGTIMTAYGYNYKTPATNTSKIENNTEVTTKDNSENEQKAANMLRYNALSESHNTTNIKLNKTSFNNDNADNSVKNYINLNYILSDALCNLQKIDCDYKTYLECKNLTSVSDFNTLDEKFQNLKDLNNATESVFSYIKENYKNQFEQIKESTESFSKDSPVIQNFINYINQIGVNDNNLLKDYCIDIINNQVKLFNSVNNISSLALEYEKINILLEKALNEKRMDFVQQKEQYPDFANELDVFINDIDNLLDFPGSVLNLALTTSNNKKNFELYREKVEEWQQAIDKLQEHPKINSDWDLSEELRQTKNILIDIKTKLNSAIECYAEDERMNQKYSYILNRNNNNLKELIMELLVICTKNNGITDDIQPVNKNKADNTYYNLGGQVTKPKAHGIYINNGKKILYK